MLVKLLIPEHSGIKDKYTALTTESINILQTLANMYKKVLANMGKRIPADISNNLRRARLAFTTGNIKNAVKFYMAAIEKMIKLLSKSQYRYHYKDTVEIGTSFEVNTSFKEKSIQTSNYPICYYIGDSDNENSNSDIKKGCHDDLFLSSYDNTDANFNTTLNSMPSTGDESISSLISPVLGWEK